MKTKFTIASQRNPIYASYSDTDIQNQYASADNKRKALMIDYDRGKVTDEDIDAIDKLLFRLGTCYIGDYFKKSGEIITVGDIS